MRRRWGGEWSLESAIQPGTVITLHIAKSEIWPPEKVYKRLVNGSQDNIWDYYQILKADYEKARPS